ncbi:hypothetical protein B0T24DRAFT_599572 [Lasiosphaeria ovina]|uniref:Uncharacterized protein n=1 Tax=Lasiosphaeria ovina TaxID=92902 RepID=A0AAE0JSY8_9PEZI|nr:hypothetical protein B0T24DRAFT_599572 [Lasiosphaeria ovina]
MNFAKGLGLAALAAIASASASATVSGESLTHPITSAPVLVHATFGTSSPIRTVVTVNSNRIDVLAGSEQDVPKVIEKLRQLCAGPHASMYPEICEHLDAVGSGVDPIIWWPPDHETHEAPITSRNPEDLFGDTPRWL